jgi:hypothetical protein
MRMTDTRDLNHLTDITYLDDFKCLNVDQKNKLWILVQDVQSDPRYADVEDISSLGSHTTHMNKLLLELLKLT